MNIKYFAIRSIVLLQAFLSCQYCISQDNSQQLPNIGYDWDELYYDQPEAKAAAVAWVKNFDTITSEYTVKNIIEHCGMYFYKLKDNVIAEKLMKSVNMTMNPPNVQEFSKKMKFTVDSIKSSWSRYTYYQIWDFDYKFTISYPNGSNYGYVVPEYKKIFNND
ncbi:hypothetical protein QQ054_04305 [Oscillatoria amoena NRMC-F 0135]|nr:hypothetical protein [Oscillatoria amoena NRMC-F 0135]